MGLGLIRIEKFLRLKSIRTFNPNESGQSELIRINPNFQSEWIWSIPINPNFQSVWIQSIRSIRTFNPYESDLSESIRTIKKNSVSFGLIGVNRIERIVSSDEFWLIRIDRIHSEWNCLVRIQISVSSTFSNCSF